MSRQKELYEKDLETFLRDKKTLQNHIKSIWEVEKHFVLDKALANPFDSGFMMDVSLTLLRAMNEFKNDDEHLKCLNLFVMLTSMKYMKSYKIQTSREQIKYFLEGDEIKLSVPRPSFQTTSTYVDECDWMEAIDHLKQSGSDYQSKILLLNNANQDYPCGEWGRGGTGQEENITRRSNYYQFLHLNSAEVYREKKWSAILSKKVTIFRGTEEDGYRFLPKPFELDILAVSSIKFEPKEADRKEYKDIHYKEMDKKIKTIFQIALQEGYEVLVVGAFGCGRRKNDPSEIAMIFDQYVGHYRGHFKKIVFAIKSKNISSPFLKKFGSYSNPKPYETFTDMQKMEIEYIPDFKSQCQNCKKSSSNIMISKLCGHKLCLSCWNIKKMEYCPMVGCGKLTGSQNLNTYTEQTSIAKPNVKCDFCKNTGFEDQAFVLECNHIVCSDCRNMKDTFVKCLVCQRTSRAVDIKPYKTPSSGSLKCTICIDSKTDIWISKQCGHTACKDCWTSCFGTEKKKPCPFCKTQILYSDLVRAIIN